jgi:hypothetical protein
MILWLLSLLLFADNVTDGKNAVPTITVESLQARIAQLEQQLEQAQRTYQFEMAVCGGALQAARQMALAPKPAQAQRSVRQQSTGPNSPNINGVKGDVNVPLPKVP